MPSFVVAVVRFFRLFIVLSISNAIAVGINVDVDVAGQNIQQQDQSQVELQQQQEPSLRTTNTNTNTNTINHIDNHIHKKRMLSEMMTSTSDAAAASQRDGPVFNPVIFWTVNAFFIIVIAAICLYCKFGGDTTWLTHLHDRRQDTDLQYQQTLAAREERRKQALVMNPNKRRKLLLKAFRKDQVLMTVSKDDIIQEDLETAVTETLTVPTETETETERTNDTHENNINLNHDESERNQTDNDNENENVNENMDTNNINMNVDVSNDNHNDDTISLDSHSHQSLALPNGTRVPNCCAICLGNYEVDEQVVWSSNPECGHAFHLECIMDWLIQHQPATPCPCCRAEFTDWDQIKREHKIKWTPDQAFNTNAIRLTDRVRL